MATAEDGGDRKHLWLPGVGPEAVCGVAAAGLWWVVMVGERGAVTIAGHYLVTTWLRP